LVVLTLRIPFGAVPKALWHSARFTVAAERKCQEPAGEPNPPTYSALLNYEKEVGRRCWRGGGLFIERHGAITINTKGPLGGSQERLASQSKNNYHKIKSRNAEGARKNKSI